MDGLEKLKEKLEKKERIYSTILLHWGFTGLPQMYKNCGMDFILADLEHGSFFPENLGDFAYACRLVDIPLIARVQDCEYHCISKAIDMGADGVLIPRTETMEQVETAIRSMRMFPYGKKGVGGRALLRKGETVEDFNRNRLLFLQIESTAGVELLDEMLTKHGDQVAGVIIGPSDMTVSMGYPLGLPEMPDKLVANIMKTIEVSGKHGKSVGMFMNKDEACARWHKAGMNIFWFSTELDMLAAEVRRVRKVIMSLE